jgi:Spx/MgsR family transcriptional regulator
MYKIYGISTCNTISKSKKWLDQHNIDYQFHDYRKEGLDDALLTYFSDNLGWEAILNRRSTSWRQLTEEQKSNLDRKKAIHLMLQHPTLIKRPILDINQKLILGFNAAQYQTEL